MSTETKVLNSDMVARLMVSDNPPVFLVVSEKANHVGIFDDRFGAEKFLRSRYAPDDSILIPLVMAPTESWIHKP